MGIVWYSLVKSLWQCLSTCQRIHKGCARFVRSCARFTSSPNNVRVQLLWNGLLSLGLARLPRHTYVYDIYICTYVRNMYIYMYMQMGTIWDYSINNSHCISRDFLPNAMFGSRPQRSKEKTAALRHAFLKRWRRQRKTSSN